MHENSEHAVISVATPQDMQLNDREKKTGKRKKHAKSHAKPSERKRASPSQRHASGAVFFSPKKPHHMSRPQWFQPFRF